MTTRPDPAVHRPSAERPDALGALEREQALAPGARVAARDERTLQIVSGDGSRSVTVPETPTTRAALRCLARAEGEPVPIDLLAHLDRAGLLVDARERRAAERAGGAAATAMLAGDPRGGAARLRRRGRARVGLVGADGDASDGPAARIAAQIADLLDAGGTTARLAAVDAPGADVVVVASTGEPRRDLVDGLLRADRPHLLVAALGHVVRVGPFVDPGRTACLRCIDAALTEADARHPLILEQVCGPPPGAAPAPCDPPSAAIAAGWAAHDVLAYLEGREPRTWSSTVRVDDRLDPTTRRWQPHPWCGCSWEQ